MREHGIEHFSDVKLAMLEIDGTISIISEDKKNLKQTHYKRKHNQQEKSNLLMMTDNLDWNTQYQSRAKMIERIASGEIAFEPDTKGEYSNSNYVLLSFILEDIYKKSYSVKF